MFNDDLTDHLTAIMPNLERNVILGDFNMHIDDIRETEASIFIDTMMALGLDQHVTKATHHKGNNLDLIYTELNSDVKVSYI